MIRWMCGLTLKKEEKCRAEPFSLVAIVGLAESNSIQYDIEMKKRVRRARTGHAPKCDVYECPFTKVM